MSDLSVHWEISEILHEQPPLPLSITEDRHRSDAVPLVGVLAANASGSSADGLSVRRPGPPWVAEGSENSKQQHGSGAIVGGFSGSDNIADGDHIDGNGDRGVDGRAKEVNAKRGPFSIVPGSVVVPSGDEVSFDVVFSPTSLGCTE